MCLDAKTECRIDTGCTECNEGFTGGNCLEDINECVETPDICGDHSTCENKNGTYACICDYGYERGPTSCECEYHLVVCYM